MRQQPTAVVAFDAPAPDAMAISEVQVRALVDAWLAAQNDGDFAAYSSLYDRDFIGIKRAGDRMQVLSRDEWLVDRRRMFESEMKVIADNIVIDVGDEKATVRFDQTWSSGSYADFGPKQLAIVRQPSGLRIVREELLSSVVRRSKRLAKTCTKRAVGRANLARDPSAQLVLAEVYRPRKIAEECDIVNFTVCLMRGKTLIEAKELPGQCVGACTPEAVAEGEKALAEAEAAVAAGELEGIPDYDFTGCRFEGIMSSELREAGGRTWALLQGQVTGPHDFLFPSFRLATVLCDRVFVSEAFGGWPMMADLDELVIEVTSDSRKIAVSANENATRFPGKKWYELKLGADECRDPVIENVLH